MEPEFLCALVVLSMCIAMMILGVLLFGADTLLLISIALTATNIALLIWIYTTSRKHSKEQH